MKPQSMLLPLHNRRSLQEACRVGTIIILITTAVITNNSRFCHYCFVGGFRFGGGGTVLPSSLSSSILKTKFWLPVHTKRIHQLWSVDQQRRKFVEKSSYGSIASLILPWKQHPVAATAAIASADTETSNMIMSNTSSPGLDSMLPYTRIPSSSDKFQFSYTIIPPPSFVASNKPLKTHLDEINFAPPPDVNNRGYTLGITVDPVRISSIRQFGTPEEVAARVVTAEINRDGVFEVTLAKDPREDIASGGGYDIEYISDGKRGKKRFVSRIFVKDGFLYVLTIQSKESDYDEIREAEVLECARSFKPL